MSLLEVIQWLCHDCSCETQLVPSAGIFRCCRTSGGFSVGKRRCGRHFLSWGADSSLRSARTGFPCKPTLVILAGWGSLLAAWSCRSTAARCHSWLRGTGLLSQVAPCPQPVAMELQPHVLSNVLCPRGELWSRGKRCHRSCFFLARREKMISHACQSGSFLQHWISASLLKFLFKNPNLRQHSTWHLTLWLPWR